MEMQDSIRTTTVWQTENDIVVPVTVQETVKTVAAPGQQAVTRTAASKPKVVIKAHKGVPALLAYPYTGEENDVSGQTAEKNVEPADSVAADSVQLSLPVPGEVKEGIILINPAKEFLGKETHLPKMHWSPMSWVYLGLALLFCVVAIKFKGNSR